LNFGKGAKFPYIKIAILEAALASPPHKIQSGMCKLILPTSLTELLKKDKRPDLEKAENIMSEARSICKGLNLSQANHVKYVGLLDVRLCLHLLIKVKDFETLTFKSLDNIVEVPHLSAHIACACTHIYTCACEYVAAMRHRCF